VWKRVAPRTLAFFVVVAANTVCAAQMRFALIGDYGSDDAAERMVANFVITNLQPEFVVTLGDNNYGTETDYDQTVGKYYSRYIGNYAGAYGSGSPTNRFFPAIGNHDYFDFTDYAPYTNYFTLPGNERYYDVRKGPVHIFILNSELNEPHGVFSNSAQGAWLSNRLATSRAPWKLVITHYAPYSSSGSYMHTRWPYSQWGADIVLSGHSHNYERLFINQFPYIVNGAGGSSLHPMGSPVAGSQVRIDDKYGAMLAIADDGHLTFEFYSAADRLLRDRVTLEHPRLHIRRNPTAGTVDISWPTNRAAFFRLETSWASADWIGVGETPVIRGTSNVVSLAPIGQGQTFRLHKP
jgi:tartrate-resistant acid phosphatase type 5